MFEVDNTTRKITMHRGDTGSITFTATGYNWATVNAKALFSMRRKDQIVKEQIYDIPSSGQFTVEFLKTDTDYLKPGMYEYDVRVYLDPTIENGKIVNGTVVRTPWDPIPVEIKRTVGQ